MITDITVLMTCAQANIYRSGAPFPNPYLADPDIYAHYISIPSIEWNGWDRVDSICRRDQPILTYAQFLALPKPVTTEVLFELYPEHFI